MHRVNVVHGDITTLDVEAIVNAANERLLGGGGVDGAIHKAAGPALLEACRTIPEIRPDVRCPTGESRITPGFELSARYVIHTVGPIWRGGECGEAQQLANCYCSALQLALDHELRTIAFPAISCGVYGYPVRQAATVAKQAVSAFLTTDRTIQHVLMVAFEPDVHAVLKATFQEE